MCGITGIVNIDRERAVSEDLMREVCAVTHHRGPDETGTWTDGPVGLGMNRLSIIDVAGGSQPIHNEDQTAWIVFNGEIYNHREVRADLEARGHSYYTLADTETILHAYEEFGTDCVNHLRGMFGIAIWDAKQHLLFLARDRLGIKPLHYAFDGHRLIFGSEIKSILAYPGVARELHPPALIPYLAFGYVPEPDTMFRGIHKLPPGHTLTLRDGRIEIHRYWDVQYRPGKPQPEEHYIERLLDILGESVKMRLMSDVPLGAFLSGGNDSSMIVALMASHMSEPVKTFSVGFEEQQYSELPQARAVAELFSTNHYEEIVKPDVEHVIVDLVRQFDEPFSDSSAIPTYYVARAARKHVTVALSGDGGDELFAGYLRYLDPPSVRRANWIPRPVRDRVLGGIARALPSGARGASFLQNMTGDADEQYLRRVTRGLSTIHDTLVTPEFAEQLEDTDPALAMRAYMRAQAADPLTRRQLLDTKTYLPDDILTKVDRTSMLVSLEARVPILDHKLVEFAATIPPQLKIQGTTTKYIFKKAAERLLPKEIIYRPKKGFTTPIKHWLRGEWAHITEELVLSDRARARGHIHPAFVQRMVTEHRSGKNDNSALIWTLMMLELWFREKIDVHVGV